MTKAAELREMSDEQIDADLEGGGRAIVSPAACRLKPSGSTPPANCARQRRLIARCQTILNERKAEASRQPREA